MSQFEDKKILVTGGAGSIGSEIVRELLNFHKPAVVRVLDNHENSLFHLKEELKDHKNVRFLQGDITDKHRLKMALEDINIVFHAAALKHVPILEYTPFEGTKVNVLGTQNVIDACLEEGIEKMINISTDKAANPYNTLGATKLLGERLVTSAENYKGKRKTIFCSVRFGNVFGSRGSIVPLLKDQIKNRRLITVTDNQMTRFFMSIKDAVNLVFKACEMMKGGEVFIFKMRAVKLKDLVDVVVEGSSKIHGIDPNEIKIEYIGARPGEKLHEELLTEHESRTTLETEDMFIILPQIQLEKEISYNFTGAIPSTVKSLSSSNVEPMSKDEIKRLLEENGLL